MREFASAFVSGARFSAAVTTGFGGESKGMGPDGYNDYVAAGYDHFLVVDHPGRHIAMDSTCNLDVQAYANAGGGLDYCVFEYLVRALPLEISLSGGSTQRPRATI